MAETVTVPAPGHTRLRRRAFNLVRNLLAIAGLVLIIYHSGFYVSRVVSDSMSPTLQGDGKPGSDWVLSEKISLLFRKPRRWEVVHFWSEDQLLIAKRVAGLPGETVSLQDKQVVINGALVPPPRSLAFLRYYQYGSLRKGHQAACGNAYFLLGDDSKDSVDSRFEGPVDLRRIHSRTWLRVWPLSRVGFVNP